MTTLSQATARASALKRAGYSSDSDEVKEALGEVRAIRAARREAVRRRSDPVQREAELREAILGADVADTLSADARGRLARLLLDPKGDVEAITQDERNRRAAEILRGNS